MDTPKAEAIIVTEEALTNALADKALADNEDTFVKFAEALAAKDEGLAKQYVSQVDLRGPVEELKAQVGFYGLTAMFIGVGFSAGKAEGSKVQGLNKKPEVIDTATTQVLEMASRMGDTLRGELNSAVEAVMAGVITEEKARKRTVQDYTSFGHELAKTRSRDSLHLIASLHNTRLASYGYLLEAQLSGVDTYAINEILDGRICPVCRELHGKQFTVAETFETVDKNLRVEDPDQLKTMAPWPKQDKQSLEQLRAMTSAELRSNGFVAPPFHPRCRGVLNHTKHVPPLEDSTQELNQLINLLDNKVRSDGTIDAPAITTAEQATAANALTPSLVDSVRQLTQQGSTAIETITSLGISLAIYNAALEKIASNAV